MESAEPDLKLSQVTVKGVFDPAKLMEYVHKRTGKQAVMVKQEPEKKEKTEEGKEEKKEEEKKEEKKEEAKTESPAAAAETAEEATATATAVEVKKNEYYYYPQRYAMEMYAYPPPQMFSDENPNACSVM